MFNCNYDPWSDENEEELQKTLEIEKIKARWTQAKKDLEDAQYLERLIHSDYVRTIRSFKSVWDYRSKAIENARTEIGKKKKKERENLSYIEQSIKEDFFSTNERVDIKIKDIIAGGYEDYYWLISFDIFDAEFLIQIPMREKLTVKNLSSAHNGKFVFLKKTNSHTTTVLFDDWTEKGLATQIEEYFKVEVVSV